MEYDMNKIRALCDRYFDGETSAGEELRLREYFLLAEDVPADLRVVKVMLCGMDEAASMTYSPSGTGQHTTRGSVRKMSIRRIIWGTIAAAASVAICISVFNREIYGYDADGKAITDPQKALEGTKYLAYLSQLETTIDIAQMITMEMEDNN